MKLVSVGSCALALALLVQPVEAQTLKRITPEAASPGSLVIVDGEDLAGTTHLRFTAFVGGFVGIWIEDAPVIDASATRVTAFVPDIVAGFIPPGSIQGGSYVGTVEAIGLSTTGAGAGDSLDFFFLEAPFGFLENAGLGSTQPDGTRAVISFELQQLQFVGGSLIHQGAPFPGNDGFTPRLENAIPGSLAFLAAGPALGVPIPGPGDGLLALSPGNLFFVLGAPTVDGAGDAELVLPVPPGLAGLNLQAALQWGFVDPLTGTLRCSNALVLDFSVT